MSKERISFDNKHKTQEGLKITTLSSTRKCQGYIKPRKVIWCVKEKTRRLATSTYIILLFNIVRSFLYRINNIV